MHKSAGIIAETISIIPAQNGTTLDFMMNIIKLKINNANGSPDNIILSVSRTQGRVTHIIIKYTKAKRDGIIGVQKTASKAYAI